MKSRREPPGTEKNWAVEVFRRVLLFEEPLSGTQRQFHSECDTMISIYRQNDLSFNPQRERASRQSDPGMSTAARAQHGQMSNSGLSTALSEENAMQKRHLQGRLKDGILRGNLPLFRAYSVVRLWQLTENAPSPSCHPKEISDAYVRRSSQPCENLSATDYILT